LAEGELYAFYQRNNICEAQYGKALAEAPLKHEGVWAAANNAGEPIAFARALYDGVSAVIVEMCLDLRYQTQNNFENGCFVESDLYGIAGRTAKALLNELRRRGCHFFSYAAYEGSAECGFYKALGFYENEGHKEYVIDARPYVHGGPERGERIDTMCGVERRSPAS